MRSHVRITILIKLWFWFSVEHIFEVVIEGIRGLSMFDNMMWGEADCFIQYHFPTQSQTEVPGAPIVRHSKSQKISLGIKFSWVITEHGIYFSFSESLFLYINCRCPQNEDLPQCYHSLYPWPNLQWHHQASTVSPTGKPGPKRVTDRSVNALKHSRKAI